MLTLDAAAGGGGGALTHQRVLYYVICYFEAFDAYFGRLRQRVADAQREWAEGAGADAWGRAERDELLGRFSQAGLLGARLDTLYGQTVQLTRMKRVCRSFCSRRQYKRLQVHVQQFVEAQFRDTVAALVGDMFGPRRARTRLLGEARATGSISAEWTTRSTTLLYTKLDS